MNFVLAFILLRRLLMLSVRNVLSMHCYKPYVRHRCLTVTHKSKTGAAVALLPCKNKLAASVISAPIFLFNRIIPLMEKRLPSFGNNVSFVRWKAVIHHSKIFLAASEQG